jgi:hypothetical protein
MWTRCWRMRARAWRGTRPDRGQRLADHRSAPLDVVVQIPQAPDDAGGVRFRWANAGAGEELDEA